MLEVFCGQFFHCSNQICERLFSCYRQTVLGSSLVRWVPCHHGMVRTQVMDGGDAANILNKQSRTANNGWSSSLGVGRGANNSSP
jgi:hypothetical protein